MLTLNILNQEINAGLLENSREVYKFLNY